MEMKSRKMLYFVLCKISDSWKKYIYHSKSIFIPILGEDRLEKWLLCPKTNTPICEKQVEGENSLMVLPRGYNFKLLKIVNFCSEDFILIIQRSYVLNEKAEKVSHNEFGLNESNKKM